MTNRRSILVPVLAGGLVIGACSSGGTPGVLVNPLATDIVFGLAEEERATPADFPTPSAGQQASSGPVPPEIPPVTLPELRPSGPGTFAGGSGEDGDCPAAALTEFPDESASVVVRGLPNEGIYRFRKTVTTSRGDDARPKPVSGFQEHEIRNVKRESETLFTFELVQPDTSVEGVDRRVVSHFTVNTNPDLLVNEGQGGQTIGVIDIPEADAQVPEPGDEAGIFLTKIESTVGEESTTDFEPLPPVKYLALDEGIVTAGDTWETVSVDPTTGDVLVHSATVTRTNRIDACGDIVEGWEIEAEQTYNDATRTYRYTFATQYGAMLIGEVSNSTDGETSVQTRVHIADDDLLVEGFGEDSGGTP